MSVTAPKPSEAFFKFLSEVQPVVRNGRGGFVPYMPTGEMRDAIAQALDGNFSMACLSWPRRHGKTTAVVMIALWRLLTRPAESIGIIANSQLQAVDTGFKMIVDALRHTPRLAALVKADEVRVLADRVEVPGTASALVAYPANPSALWGKKLTCAQVSELHAATSPAVLEAIQGSLLDSAGSLLLVDSTVGPASSPIADLYTASNDPDSGVFFSHIEYRDLDDAIARGPAWIDVRKLRTLARTMLPQQFALQHLNRWGDASSSLFPRELIDRCTITYPLDPTAIAAGGSFVVGGGLDRALGIGLNGKDGTYTCAVVKTIDDAGDDVFHLLAVDRIAFNRSGGIRAAFTHYARDFGMTRAGIESFNAGDILEWAVGQPEFGAGTDMIQPTRRSKAAAFTALHAAAAEGRLQIHPDFSDLLDEMSTFEVRFDGAGGEKGAEEQIPKFAHAKGKHDDALHALAWAVWSLRDAKLSGYSLDAVNCTADTTHAVRSCALNGGAEVPFTCADRCRSMTQARALHTAYIAKRPVAPLPLDEFIAQRVTVDGPHTLPRLAA